jgi:8-oxo-dGTP diphosphatase
MKQGDKNHPPVQAAGGIVVREMATPLIAIVRARKSKAWVLPKGKLKPGESAIAAARREAFEETGHEVTVHEFLGAMSHASEGKYKVVQFWRMQARGGPVRKLAKDIKAVKWLPLRQAIDTLTYPHERVFLNNVGPAALAAVRETQVADGFSFIRVIREWLRRIRAWISPKGHP